MLFGKIVDEDWSGNWIIRNRLNRLLNMEIQPWK